MDLPGKAFTTKGGSVVRELMHPSIHGSSEQSPLTVPVGATTSLHQHSKTEEVYHVMAGQGLVALGQAQVQINTGDTICISTQHCITNTGGEPLTIICAHSPPLSDQPVAESEAAS